jgi:hypothetical protein
MQDPGEAVTLISAQNRTCFYSSQRHYESGTLFVGLLSEGRPFKIKQTIEGLACSPVVCFARRPFIQAGGDTCNYCKSAADPVI